MDEILKYLREKGFLTEEADEKMISDKVSEYLESEMTEKTKGLVENRDKIKDEKLKLKEQFDALTAKYQFVDDNDLSVEVFLDMKNDLENFRANNGTDEEIQQKIQESYERGKKQSQEVYEPQLAKIKGDFDNEVIQREKAVKMFRDYKAESEIRKAVGDTGVKASEIWFKGLMSNAKIEFDDKGSMDISLPQEGVGFLPIQDWIKSWPTTEEAKRMMPAKISSGAGAYNGGDGGDGGDNTSLADQYNSMFKQ